MKKYIKSASTYTGEPDNYALGKAISDANKKRNERYWPFIISNWNESPTSFRKVGYIISVSDEYPDELAYDGTRWYVRTQDNKYRLFGAYDMGDPTPKWYQLNSKDQVEFIGEFNSLDAVISYLYTEYDIEEV